MIAFAPGPNTSVNLCAQVACHAKRIAQAFDITLDILLTFVSTAEHLLFALPYVAAVSTSIDARPVVTQIIEVRTDCLGRYLYS